MSYFNSLNDWSATQKAVEQHTTDAVESYNNAKADADAKAFQGYSQLLESAGGSTTGLAGGFHLTRKIYKKYKQGKKAIQDAKNAVDKAKGQPKEEEGGEEGGEDEGGEDEGGAPSTEEGGTEADAPEPDATTAEAPETESSAPEPSTEAPEVDNAPTQSAPEPESNGLEASDPDLQETPLAPEDEAYLQDILARHPEDVQRGADMTNEAQQAEAPNAEATNAEAPSADTQMSSFSNEGQGADSGAVRPTNTAPEPTTDAPSTTDAPEPTTDAPEADATEGADEGAEAADRLEQGAKAFEGVKPTPSSGLSSLGKDAGVDDIIDAGSSTLGDVGTALSVGLDFLGPVGEVVGAGIAIGGFFHDLFGKDDEAKTETQDATTAGSVATSGGISTSSIKSSQQTSLNVGTAY